MVKRVEQPGRRQQFHLWILIFSAFGLLFSGPAHAAIEELQRVIAVVNDQAISNYDLEKRVSLMLAATGGNVTPQERQAIEKQALQSLIDEKLELQEAKRFKVTISDKEIEETFDRIGQQYNFTPAQFKHYLEGLGTTKEALTNQIHAELAWSELVRGRLRQQINVSDDEVQAVLKRLEESAGKNEYRVSEIYLLAETPDQERQVLRTARQLVSEMKSGASFAQIAHQFSDAPTAAVGGDMGWIPQGQLSPEIDSVLQKLTPGEVSAPIKSAGGYYIIKLRDKRKILTADPMDARLEIYQMYFKFPDGADDAAKTALGAKIGSEAAKISTCKGLPDQAKALSPTDQGNLGTLRLGDLSPAMQKVVNNIPVGHASPPVAAKDGLRILVVCGRQEPEVTMPTAKTVEESLSQQRLSMLARGYLRDLRRDAIIDYP